MDGQLRRIYRDLQYGFIDHGKDSYFFHKSDYRGDWGTLCTEHDRGVPVYMMFKPISTDKGLRAKDVELSDV